MRFIPKVSLHGSGEVVELSNGSHADFTLMQGSTGLGMGPREISTVALPSGGSLVNHRRRAEAEIQLPILLGGSERNRWDLRRKLERLVRDEVEIRVTRPNGVYRSRFGYYKDGLGGEYGAGEDSPDGQKIVLEFLCPDGLWHGEEQTPKFRLSGLRKRFLSDAGRPIPTEVENVVVNPSLTVNEDGWEPYKWTGTAERVEGAGAVGDGFYRMTATGTMTGASGRYRDHSAYVSPGESWTLSAFVRPSRDLTMQLQGEFRGGAGVVGEAAIKGNGTFCKAGEWTRLNLTIEASGLATEIRQQIYLQSATVQSGDTLDIDGEMVARGELVAYFDGDTAARGENVYGWLGKRGNSASAEYVTNELKYQSPFFPVVLSSSTVQGEITVNIGGDAPVYPTWVIDGPGTDLIIENDKGDVIKVLTEITDQVTITTDPLRQDITSPSKPDGELWEYVPTYAVFFPLEPGKQKIKMSMVGAKPNSLVRCLYRENYWSGW